MKNICASVKDILSFYIDDALPAGKKKFVEDHLATCSSCKQEYEALKEIVSELKELPMQPLPPQFTESLHVKLVAESLKTPPKKSFIHLLKPYSAVAAGLIMAVLIGTGYYDHYLKEADNAYIQHADVVSATKAPKHTSEPVVTGDSAAQVQNRDQQPAVKGKTQQEAKVSSKQNQKVDNTETQPAKTQQPQATASSEQKIKEAALPAPEMTQDVSQPEIAQANDIAPLMLYPPEDSSEPTAATGGNDQAIYRAVPSQYFVYTFTGSKAFVDAVTEQYTVVTESGQYVVYADENQVEAILDLAAAYNASYTQEASETLSSNKCIIVTE